MPIDRNRVAIIVDEARKHSTELPWIEFKTSNADFQAIGEYVSALSNTAALFSQSYGFIVWGIDDRTHEVVGTTFSPTTEKRGNEELPLWISTQLEPNVQFYFHDTELYGKHIVMLEIYAATTSPVRFRGIDYIRIGTSKKKLKDYPDTERELWAIFAKKPFEEIIALEDVPGDLVMRLLDYPAYFDLASMDLPANKVSILEKLQSEKMINKSETGNYNITNFGAILFAKRLSDFPALERKAVRVIIYSGTDKISAVSKEQLGAKGYAAGFEGLIGFINSLIPQNEILGDALRRDVPMYPEIAIRELVANAIIHQDFFLKGTSPVIEIYQNRIEISNPGTPLIEKNRFVDAAPISRNERIAGFMRRIGVCEERGSGFDKVVFQTEFYQLPAPEVEVYDTHTKVILFAYQPYSKMSRQDRQRACYLHSCLKRVSRELMTNASLRKRFSISEKNTSMISRLLKETCEAGLIKVSDDSTSDKNRRYLPYWA